MDRFIRKRQYFNCGFHFLAGIGNQDKPTKKTSSRKLVHGTLGWHCAECPNLTFESKKSLLHHKKTTHSLDKELQYNYYVQEDKYFCKTCDLEFKDLDGVKQHVVDHEEKYKCNVCAQSFKKLFDYVLHAQDHSRDDFLSCVLCKYKTKHKNRMLIHVNQIHLGRLNYVCKVCKKGFRDVSMYKEHVESHMSEVGFTCIVCDKKFDYSRYLVDHQQRCHRVNFEGTLPPNQCPICKKIFSKESTAIKHIPTHKSENRKKLSYLCDLCGKSYGTKTKLKEHHRVHTGEKPFKCNTCNKAFSKRYYLTLHERTHTGVKPYFCEHCGKSFNQLTPFNIHKRQHTGEKPYSCEICKKAFPSRAAVVNHMKTTRGH